MPKVLRKKHSFYRNIIKDAIDANFNMLRVWGGGSFEDDEFYNQADEQGILIWQDFFFANSMYPADNSFLKNVIAETRDNLRRIRNHACLAHFAGNNEI